MAGAAATADNGKPAGGRGKKRLALVLGLPLLLAGGGAGLWLGGLLPRLLGHHAAAVPAEAADAARPPVFVELPDIVANLNGGARRNSFVKLKVRLELSRPGDEAPFRAALPRVQDLFQSYLREMRPEELRGSIGTHRLREELLARASLAAAPARVVDVLFTEMLVQ